MEGLRKLPRQGGYSLFELVGTVALAGIVLTLGVPSLGRIAADARLRVHVDALFHAIHLARKESVVRRRVMTICPTADGVQCADDWVDGWMLFANLDRDRPAHRDVNEPVVRLGLIHDSVKIAANRRSFTLRSTQLRATNGTIVVCDRRGRARPRALVVSYTGRPRVAYESPRDIPYQCPD